MHAGAKGAGERAALERQLGARAAADVRAATRPALLGVGLEAAVDEDDALQVGLVALRAAAHAAAPSSGYEGASASASSSVGWWASAWWESRPQ